MKLLSVILLIILFVSCNKSDSKGASSTLDSRLYSGNAKWEYSYAAGANRVMFQLEFSGSEVQYYEETYSGVPNGNGTTKQISLTATSDSSMVGTNQADSSETWVWSYSFQESSGVVRLNLCDSNGCYLFSPI